MTRSDPAVRHTIARQLVVFRELRREGKTLCRGAPYTPAANTDVRRIWRLYDWKETERA